MKLGQLLAFDPESLVLGKMQMEKIELYRLHTVEVAPQNVERHKMAATIDHQAAPGKAGRVPNGSSGYSKSGLRVADKLTEGLKATQRP